MSSKPRGYAVDTDVPVVKTRAEIDALCAKHGAKNIATLTEEKRATIAFELRGLRIVFRLPLPNAAEQDRRSRWRGLLLCIKAKFEAVNRGVETFEEAFLAHVLTPNGDTLAEQASGRLQTLAAGNVPLLPGPRA